MTNFKRRLARRLVQLVCKVFKTEIAIELRDNALVTMGQRVAFLEQQNACLSHGINILSAENAELKKSKDLLVQLGTTWGVEINTKKLSLN